MSKSRFETAKDLAKAHFANEPKLQHVYILEAPDETHPREPIKLLEVVEGTIERGVEPIAFAANRGLGIDYPVWIVEVSPREYADEGISRELQSRGWRIADELTAT